MSDRPCTCHPDDNPPVPCPQKFALSECKAAPEPVAWMVYTKDGKSVFVTDNPTDIPAECAALPLFTSPPAAPCVGNDPACPCQDGDLCHYKDSPDGKTKAWAAPAPATVDQIMKLADEWYSHGQTSHSGINEKYAALRAAVERVIAERDEARESDGWKWTESARKDRAAAVSQWRAAKERAERAEAELKESALRGITEFDEYRELLAERDALRAQLAEIRRLTQHEVEGGRNDGNLDWSECAEYLLARIDAALNPTS